MRQWALDRIAKHMKADRDAHFETKNAAGATVNRWTSVAFLAAAASSNETAHLYGKFIRSLGAISADNQARL